MTKKISIMIFLTDTPKNHVDINYSQTTTFKIGLKNRLSLESFKSLMDLEQDCFFIN